MKASILEKKYQKEHEAPKSLDLSLIKRLLSYIKPYSFRAGIAITCLMIAKMIEAFVPVYLGYTAQQIINAAAQSPEEKAAVLTHVWHVCFWIFSLLLLGYGLESMSIYLKSWVGQKAIFNLRTQVYKHIQHLSLSYFDKVPIGKLMTRAIHDVEQISLMLTDSLVPLFGSVLLFVGMLIGFFFVDSQAAIIFLVIVPFVIFLTNYFRISQRRAYDIMRNIASAMNSFTQEHLMGASTVKYFGLQKKEKAEFDVLNKDNRNVGLLSIHHFSLFISGIEILQNLFLITIFVLLTLTAPPESGFSVGVFFTFSLYAIMFFRPLSDLAERYNVLQSAMSASERIFNILDEPIEPMEQLHEPAITDIESIVFEDVWFAYEGENWIIKGLSFEIKKAESIALVGITGSGKTTIMSLLLRFYDYQRGTIKINGRDIREYPLHALRRKFSVVLQDPVIFSGTLFDNIALYEPSITQEQVLSVIDFLGLHPLMDRFSEGLQHMLLERGKGLSMGELQLISLARALAHERDIFILDEATANIDTTTEQIIQNALKKIFNKKTSLAIAHRLSTIQGVDRIIVVHQGKLHESGTHAELIAKKGLYEKLYRVQFAGN